MTALIAMYFIMLNFSFGNLAVLYQPFRRDPVLFLSYEMK